jgi:hypothetical protein
MPPFSYIGVAILVVALVVGGATEKIPLVIYQWRALFLAVPCLLAVPGAYRIASGVGARLGAGLALVSPALAFATIGLYQLASGPFKPVPAAFGAVAHVAVLAAAAAAIHLVQKLSQPRPVFRVCYVILAVAAFTTALDGLDQQMRWRFVEQQLLYSLLSWAANTAAIAVTCGAFIAASWLIVTRRGVECWTAIVISLITAYFLYSDVRPLFVRDDGWMRLQLGFAFWAWPGAMLLGAAALWRIGALLHAMPAPTQVLNPRGDVASNDTIAGQAPVANDPATQPLLPRWLIVYFSVLAGLSFIAFMRDAITIATFMLIVPGLVLLVAPTLLYYSVAALPGYVVHRIGHNRSLALATSAACIAMAAVLPHYASLFLLEHLVASDRSDPPSVQPRSFALPFPEDASYWSNGRQPERRLTYPPAPCADLCQQLLFKARVAEVVILGNSRGDPLASGAAVIAGARRLDLPVGKDGKPVTVRVSDLPVESPEKQRAFFRPKWRRFRIEQRDTCPETWSLIEGEFVRDALAGRCLIEDTVDNFDADVSVSIATASPRSVSQQDEASVDWREINKGPATVTITERRDNKTVATESRTTLEANYARMPFYFAPKANGGLSISLVVARQPFPTRSGDPFEMLNRRYGLSIAPAPWKTRFAVPVSSSTDVSDRSTVMAILNADYGPGELMPMTPSRLVTSYVNARLTSAQLGEDDLALIRALLKQHAFTAALETKLQPSSLEQLKPLLPDMFQRVADLSDGRNGISESLNVILGRFSVADTEPFAGAVCKARESAYLEVCYRREHRASRRN